MTRWEPPQYDPGAHERRMHGQPRYPYEQPPSRPARRKRRVFMWVFLAVQALFIAWIIAGIASHPAGLSAAAQAARQCANGGWEGLFTSEADCRQHYAVALNDAGNAGKGIAIGLIIVIWVVTDFLMAVTWLVVRLSRRRA